MIRQPSTAQLYGWLRAAVNGENPPRHDGIPHCGWFKRRMVKNGPWVPVRIFIDRDIDLASGELTRDEFNHLTDYRLRDSVRMLDTRRPIDLSAAPTLPQGAF